MWSDIVVFPEPSLGLVSDEIKLREQISIQNLFTVDAVEPLDQSVLGRFSRLEIPDLDTVLCGPCIENGRSELRAIVHADGLR